MAIYYIDPHTQTNLYGTWAEPYSFSSATRYAIANGDELRIKGVALTSLLTATVYTFTQTSADTLTWVSGGSMADFTQGDIVYFPQYGSFARVTSRGTTTIGTQGTYCMLPLYNSQVGSATGGVTVRKVNMASYPASTTSGTLNLMVAGVNNITITDGWTSETTRVTDGTVKSLITSSTTSGVTVVMDTTTLNRSGWNIDMPNSHILHGNSSSTGQTLTTTIRTSNTRITVGQLCAQWAGWGGGFNIGGGLADTVQNTVINVTHFSGQSVAAIYGRDISINMANVACDSGDFFWRDGNYTSRNLTMTIGDLAYRSASNNHALIRTHNSAEMTVNMNGTVDIYNNEYIGGIFNGYGTANVSFHPTNFSIRVNKRQTSQTTFVYKYLINRNINDDHGGRRMVPTVPNPPVVANDNSYTRRIAITDGPINAGGYGLVKVGLVPVSINIDLPMMANNLVSFPNWSRGGVGGLNTLFTFRDGSDPIELLSPFGTSHAHADNNTTFPTVTRDSVVYRTSAPSLKCTLTSRNAFYWTSNNVVKTGIAAKAIKIPMIANTSYTVSGYIRTDDSAVVNGDTYVRIVVDDTTVLASQNMTTAAINAWEGFTLTFTAPKTGEANFVWYMYFPNGAKSFWLDDLTIT